MLLVAKNVKRCRVRAPGRQRPLGYYSRHQGIELDGKVLGLVGFGRIARRVARVAGGLGMRVATFDPYLPASAVPAGIDRAETLDALLRAADVVSVHIPLTG